MDARAALEALKVLHCEGHYDDPDNPYDVVCMTCRDNAGWPCPTRQIIDRALA